MRVRPALALAALAFAACFDLKPTDERPGVTDRVATLALGPRDVRIVSTDGQFEMALVGQEVVMRLSDAGVERLRRELSTERADAQAGVGNWIEKKVKGAVSGLVDKQMMLPLAAIQEARYENGEIRIIAKGDGRKVSFFESAESSDRPGSAMGRFAPEDARRFVNAVRAAKERS